MCRRRRTRLFVLLFTILVAIDVVVNWAIWRLWMRDILTGRYAGGDLARIGYVYGCRMPRQMTVSLPKQHVEMNRYDGRHVDVVTIGDSFSNAYFVGENGCYQDYIATYSDCSVLNMLPWYRGEEEGPAPVWTLLMAYNSGLFDRIKPKAVLLESVERSTISRLGRPLQLKIPGSLAEITTFYQNEGLKFYVSSDYGFINIGNYKFILNNGFFYPLFSRNLDNTVHIANLDTPCFSVARSNQLVYSYGDVLSIPYSTPSSIGMMNDNLNQISDLLYNKGIKLYFMPVVDKFDLYAPHVVANPYPSSRFFELLRPLPKRYILIDTKQILSAEVAKGIKDIYYADDTHWSWKASEAIFSKVKFDR